MTEPLTATDWIILNAVDDAQTLEQIYKRLRSTPSPIPLAEAADTIRSLVERGLLGFRLGDQDQPTCDLSDLSCIWKASFAVTSQGRESLALPKPPAPAGRSRFGAWKEHGIDLKLEDLAEVRHEMWRDFPRELTE
jgi:hypothetical protein